MDTHPDEEKTEQVSRRFEVRRELGRGGMGVVYEAFDRELGVDVALKTLRHLDPQNIYRLKQEFRALAEIEHPNLARLGELHHEAGRWFFTMELLAARDFTTFIAPDEQTVRGPTSDELDAMTRQAPDSSETHFESDTGVELSAPNTDTDLHARTLPEDAIGAVIVDVGSTHSTFPDATEVFDEPRLRAALAQVIRGLHALHEAGKVHLDIKPSNVLVDNGRVVIVDFGLARTFAHSRQETTQAWDTDARDISGTLAYMAPEQMNAEDVDPAADWYALGVMLYQALTLRWPFTGRFAQVLMSKKSRRLLTPSARVMNLPEDLEALCLALLEPDPAQRPDGEKLLRRFGGPDPTALTARSTRPQAPWAQRSVFIGRDRELGALHEAFDASVSTGGRAIVLEGEPGVGKSALVERFLSERRQRDDLVVFRGRCYQTESLPFKAFDRIIDQLTRYLSRRAMTKTLSSEIHLAAALFPVLRRMPGVAQGDGTRVDNTEQLRHTAFKGLARIFEQMASETPLIMYIDDIQWADDESFVLLEALLKPPSIPSCLFLMTMRDEGASPVELSSGLRERLEMLAVRRLSTEDSTEVLRRLGSGEQAQSTEQLEALAAESGGHPLFLQQLATFASDPEGSPHGMRLEEVIQHRIAALNTEERALIEIVAVAGAPLPSRALSGLAGLSSAMRVRALRGLASENLVHLYQSKGVRVVAPYHDRVREAVVQLLTTPDNTRLIELELTLGRALLKRLDDPSNEDGGLLFRVVNHLNVGVAQIEDDAERTRLLELNMEAGHASLRATAYGAATTYLEAAEALLPPDAWRTHLSMRRALTRDQMTCAFHTGDMTRAEVLRQTLLTRASDTLEEAGVHGLWASLESGRRYCQQAIDAGREGLVLLGAPLPERVSMPNALLEHARVRRRQGRRPIDALAELPLLQDPRRQVEVELLVTMAPAAFFVDSALLVVILMRLTVISLREGLSPASAFGFAGYGLVLSGAFGQHDKAHAFGQLALEVNERFEGHRFDAKVGFLNGAFVTGWVRPLAEARAQLDSACADGLTKGDAEYAAYAMVSSVLFMAMEGGEIDETIAHARHSLQRADTIGDVDAALIFEAILRFYAILQRGDLEGVELPNGPLSDDAFRALLSDEATPAALFWFYFFGAWRALMQGDQAQAEAMLNEAEPRKARTFAFPPLVDYHLLKLLITARKRGGRAARLRQRIACRLHEKKIATWARGCEENFRAHALIAKAERERLAGHTDAACEWLDEAARQAQRTGSLRLEALAKILRMKTPEVPRSASSEAARDATRRWGARSLADSLDEA